MALGLAKLKHDFAKHKAKAAVLGSLSVVMVVLIVKGVFDMMPQSASAELAPSAAPGSPVVATIGASSETEEHVRKGQQLWRLLRERRGIAPDVAFTFDASYFTPDPNRKSIAGSEADPRIEQPSERSSTQPATNEEAEHRRKSAAVSAAAQALIVRSTIIGGPRPVALINGQILAVGDHILDFEILAIHAREVMFRKDDVTLAVKMADNTRSK